MEQKESERSYPLQQMNGYWLSKKHKKNIPPSKIPQWKRILSGISVSHSLKGSSSKRCCHLPLILLIVFFFSLKHPLSHLPVSSSADSSKIQLPSRRVQQEEWGTLSTLPGLGVSPEECISLLHSHTKQFSAIAHWDFTALPQLDRWILRWWFIRISEFQVSCSFAHFLGAPHAHSRSSCEFRKRCLYTKFWVKCSRVCRTLAT